eukprot:NODE_98_length_21025_cov_0.475055.p2 type:complete len:707 gc:universal NODE_98_length_21025_cov_0.475055:14402-12282(-)
MDYAVHLAHMNSEPLTDDDAKIEIEEMGYVFKGNIAGLPGYFLVGKPLHKRDLDDAEIENDFLNSNKISWYEKQVGKKREHRSIPSFNDPDFKSSWHLDKSFTDLKIHRDAVDMNIMPVWDRNLHGKGIRITVVDDGISHSHPDIIDSFDPKASKNILTGSLEVNPVNLHLDHHGTRCAAEIVGRPNNKICGVGVAYDSTISGVTIIGDTFPTDSDEAQAFNYNYQSQHIFSMSWGPSDDGTQIDGPGRIASVALKNGITNGRNGTGLIYVIASGNGGLTNDDCNYDGYVNSIYTIAIGAVDIDGKSPWYGEECSAIHVVLPGGDNDNPIHTSDVENSCSSHHFGTSAAAPLASGAIALLLESNPTLGWRDVQYLLLKSTVKNSRSDQRWQTNAAGIDFHPQFGFGLLDTSKLISNAANYVNLKESFSFSVVVTPKLIISSDKATESVITIASNNKIKTAEHIQVRVDISHLRRGDLAFQLLSPKGTIAPLARSRQNDLSEKGLTWTFMTNRYWKEEIEGNWKLIIVDTYANTTRPIPINGKEESLLRSKGILHEWELYIHGECQLSTCEQDIQVPDPANWVAFGIFLGIFLIFGLSSLIYFKLIKPKREKTSQYTEFSLSNIKVNYDDDVKSSPIEVPVNYPFKKQHTTSALPRSISIDSLSTREKRGLVSDMPLSPLSPLTRSGSGFTNKKEALDLYKSAFKNK